MTIKQTRPPKRTDEGFLRGWYRVAYKNDEKRAREQARKHAKMFKG